MVQIEARIQLILFHEVQEFAGFGLQGALEKIFRERDAEDEFEHHDILLGHRQEVLAYLDFFGLYVGGFRPVLISQNFASPLTPHLS